MEEKSYKETVVDEVTETEEMGFETEKDIKNNSPYKKRIKWIIVLIVVIALAVVGVAVVKNAVNKTVNKPTRDFSNLVFSNYYQKAIDYNEIAPVVRRYYACIQEAYDNSDKKDILTFKLPSNFKDVQAEMEGLIYKIAEKDLDAIIKKGDLTESQYINSQMLNPVFTAQELIARGDLMISVIEDMTKNGAEIGDGWKNDVEKWYAELGQHLDETYEKYKNNEGEPYTPRKK